MSGWSARALARLMGVPPMTVISWINTGLVRPEKLGRGRSGHVIGLNGLLEMVTVQELRRYGFTTRDIRKAVEYLREESGASHPLAQLTLKCEGNDIVWLKDDLDEVQVSALRRPGQCLLLLPISHVYRDLLRQLTQQEDKAAVSAAN